MILIALGGNLPSPAGLPVATFRAALDKLRSLEIVPLRASQFFVTPAWPDSHDPAFVNAVVSVRTGYDPASLLYQLQRVEEAFGRRAERRNAPRSLDLDILDYEGRIETGPPCLPHPRLSVRGFVLVPLSQVDPEWHHPVSGKTVAELIEALPPEERWFPVAEPEEFPGGR